MYFCLCAACNIISFGEISIKDLNTEVSYYLRGEEFQIQLDNFSSNITESKKNYIGAQDAAFCDQIIAELYEHKL